MYSFLSRHWELFFKGEFLKQKCADIYILTNLLAENGILSFSLCVFVCMCVCGISNETQGLEHAIQVSTPEPHPESS